MMTRQFLPAGVCNLVGTGNKVSPQKCNLSRASKIQLSKKRNKK